MNTPAITLTERAAAHVRSYLAKHATGIGLRLAVKPTGCSGYQYVVEAAEGIGEPDQTFESNGVRIVVDTQSLRYLAGTELDYVREGLNEGFRFNNPNVEETCGCGESFNISGQAAG
ncbi:MAG: iron-sulfur cluster assembly accessory protein [Gammaproteobacteria bacterium]|nr:iron-sulfur cluster assembly accessory protein [Gammaproteobacteria bacterium]